MLSVATSLKANGNVATERNDMAEPGPTSVSLHREASIPSVVEGLGVWV